ncbi:MAG: hypothetical protein GY863_01970 [bacterium]|nr:hypothetical protein [bacterium]
MMEKQKITGSIFSKIFIVLLAVLLAFSLYIPKQIWDQEVMEEEECHWRLQALVEAQSEYYKIHEVYADSLEKIIAFAQENPEFKTKLDTLILAISEQDSSEQNKSSKLNRLYISVPVTMDSIFKCPSSGLMYSIEMQDQAYRIICPTEEYDVKVYTFFKRKYISHGDINQQRSMSWK